MRMMPKKLAVARLLSFGGVGLGSSLGYFLAMSVCVDVIFLPVVVAAFVAFCVGTLISYIGNTFLTFRASHNLSTFARFLVVVFAGLLVNQAIAYSLDRAGVHYTWISLVVFIVVPLVNFIGHSLFTYRRGGA
jgi:putative flippase GtrA